MLDFFGLTDNEILRYESAMRSLNETGTAKGEEPNTPPLRIKLRDFYKGDYFQISYTHTLI